MADNEQIPEAMTDEQVLAYTQHKRKFIVGKLLNNNQLPTDKSDISMLMGALDGMDRAALGNKRIKADEKANSAIAGAAGMIAGILTRIKSQTGVDLEMAQEVAPPLLPASEVPDPVLVPGEIETNATQMNYDAFMDEVRSKL